MKRVAFLKISKELLVAITKVMSVDFKGWFYVSKHGLPSDARVVKDRSGLDRNGFYSIAIESKLFKEEDIGSDGILMPPEVLGLASQFYLCGQFISKTPRVWEFQGIFMNREKAVEACKDKNYFIAPFEFDKKITGEQMEWPGIEWPLRK